MPMLNDLSVLKKLQLNGSDLVGRVAVITGAGRGIGRAVALVLAALGAKVVIAELDEESGRAVEREVRTAGGEALYVNTDVADKSSVARLADSVRTAYGPTEILINNAILCPVCSVLDIDPELWDRVMAVNLRGALLTCKAFRPEMLARRQGTIVNMVSADAMAFMSAYISSKQALAAFSQSLSSEVAGGGVRVVAFAPGFVDTPGLRAAGRELGPRMGMTEEQFLSLSLHPAYSGMMPVEDAACATAYLIVHLADEYAGQVISGYTVLERAGYIAAAPAAPADESHAPTNAIGLAAASPVAKDRATLNQALSLLAELRQALGETEAEFGRLPVFVRPLARNGFRGKAGQSTGEWLHTLELLEQQLKSPSDSATLVAGVPRLRDLTEKLALYYEGVPAETARFTKDREFIDATRLTCNHRAEVARALAAAVAGLV